MPYTTKHHAFVDFVPDDDTDTTLRYYLLSHTPGAGFVWRQLAVEQYTAQVEDMKVEHATGHRVTARRTRAMPRVAYYGSVPIVQLVGEDGVTAEEAERFFQQEIQNLLEDDDVFGIEESMLPGVQHGHGWPPLSFIEFVERFRTDEPQPGEEIGKEDFRELPYHEQFPRGLFGMDYEA
ncbi:hypothetical protein ACOQFV_24685 [Nocardiopsis changdeensis]|uniref:Uncharacterized protein n=1 Tax=Nocardiopsis changdeensis TaxID=2831969 RepID=A0A975QCE9_9ACTN|nr:MULTISPECIES: hypothetical protein [Nocardiopsis]QUX26412.1 hypothetical protein KGD84_32455 [Nocardiopsis changdeensis]QYX40684.1 hypothetical protein K1J57_32305 [Nocardiopsis sp. MT53]